MKVKVLSAMMGSGKTTRLIKEMAEMPTDSKIMYIAPLLSECHRIAGTHLEEVENGVENITQRPAVSFRGEDGSVEYAYNDMSWPLVVKRFRHPVLAKGGSKIDSLLTQIEAGCNIVSTHALFRNMNKKVVEAIKKQGYTLILDEVLSVYEEFDDLRDEELHRLLSDRILFLDEDGMTLRWNKEILDATDTRYEDISDLCDVGQLSVVDGKVVVWEFPVEALRAFSSVTIATYLFEGSPMYSYLNTHGFNIEVEKFGNNPSDVKHLVEIVSDSKMNAPGKTLHALSQNDLVNRKTNNDALRKCLNTFFKSKYKTKSEERLWTTYKSVSRELSAGRFAQSWLYCGAKATNEWASASHVAYLVNIHIRPILVKFMSARGQTIDQDIYAVSEMVQFLWRSRIRNGENIVVYVPSSRMRGLLIGWLNGEFD